MNFVVVTNADLTEDLYELIDDICQDADMLAEAGVLEPEVEEDRYSHRKVYIMRGFTDDFATEYLRRIIFDYHDVYDTAPIVGECVQMLKDEIGFDGNSEDVCRMLEMDLDGIDTY